MRERGQAVEKRESGETVRDSERQRVKKIGRERERERDRIEREPRTQTRTTWEHWDWGRNT